MALSARSLELGKDLIVKATAGKKLRVGALLRQGAPVDFSDEYNSGNGWHGNNSSVHISLKSTALMLSAENGHLDVVKLLAAKGANIHQRDKLQCTALLLAALCDRLPVCLFLISVGADPTAEDQWQRTALTSYGQGKNAPRDHYGHPAQTVTATLDAATLASRKAALKDAREAYQNKMMHRPSQATSALLFSDAFSDLLFVCPGGERIHAHRNIVAACSPQMNALLQGPWAENKDERETVVQMPQSAESVRALLKFMYTGEVDAAACLSHTMDVLDLASQHEQPELKESCETHIVETISAETVLSVLEAAHVHDLKDLAAECTAFIVKNITKVDLTSIVEFADKYNKTDLKEACEQAAIGSLYGINDSLSVVSYLETALRLNLAELKERCINYIGSNTVFAVSREFVDLANAQPELWQDMRTAAASHA